MKPCAALLAGILSILVATPASAQWTNRYPLVAGYAHHVYLEGYELPILTNGPIDASPAPDGGGIAFASRGWLWLLDEERGAAKRLTHDGGVDSRPSWSPDGRSLVFVRDDGRNTSLVLLDVESGQTRVLVDEPAITLDPAFSADGRHVFYASAAAGDIDLWHIDPATGSKTQLTRAPGLELRPVPHPDGERLLYVAKTRTGENEIRMADLVTVAGPRLDAAERNEAVARVIEGQRALVSGRILSQTRPALSPDGRTIAFAWPTQQGWELRLTDIERSEPTLLLYQASAVPMSPAWSANGRWLYFSEADERQRMVLKRIGYGGGTPEVVDIATWDWGVASSRLTVRTRLRGGGEAAARLNVVHGDGHPVVPESGQVRFDGQTGTAFFYSTGVIELVVAPGVVRVTAVQGLATPPAMESLRIAPGERRELTLELAPVWDAAAAGWYSGDHHFHLNYGGQYRLVPEDLVPMMRGEALDVATPLLANLHERFEDQALWGWNRRGERPLIEFGQEVRSHFLGHVGLFGIRELFWPWIWGPGYQVYGQDDRPNAEPLRHARAQGGIGNYVHPVSGPDAFLAENLSSIPVSLIPDAVLGDLDALEVACLWSNEQGTTDVWHRLLNLGIPLALSAGTDVMTDFYRTMAVGATRVYVRPSGPLTFESYLDALRAGRSFVSTGPLLDLRVAAAGPGETVSAVVGDASWTLDLYTAVPVDRVELLVNGSVVWTGEPLREPGHRSYAGSLPLPVGGWIAARAVGGLTNAWPAMNDIAYAHTGAVWIGRVGSTDPAAARAAAVDLLRALDVAEARLLAGYADAEIPRLRGRFQDARARLSALAGSD